MFTLPKPEVIRCFFDTSFEPHLPAMVLRWDLDSPDLSERLWYLPDNVVLKGAAPLRFGITVKREDANTFHVRVLWNNLGLNWNHLSRRQIMASSLSPVLSALGTDLHYLLEQPLEDLKAA